MNIDWAIPIVVDFETYYDSEYSLARKEITTEKYLRCDQFECIGLSIKVGNNPTEFYRGEEWLGRAHALQKEFPNSPWVSHNNMFDMGVLSFQYNIHPHFMVDTVTLARVTGLDRVAGGGSLAKLSAFLVSQGVVPDTKGTQVHDMKGVHASDMSEKQWEAYGEYCKLDTELCYALYCYLLPHMPPDELMMAHITTQMWTKPHIDTDVALLEDYAARLELEEETTLNRVASSVGYDDTKKLLATLRSSKKFKELLESLGVESPMKWSEKQEKYIPAFSKTDLEFLELLDHPNEVVRTLIEVKLGVMGSLEKTRTATFLDTASRGLMPVPLRYASAHTGRYGGMDKANFQNLAKRAKEPVLRRSLRAPKGYAWVTADSSQIECRLNAYQANQTDVVDVFLNGKDVYLDMACKIYNEDYDSLYDQSKGPNATKEGKTKRSIAKAAVLGCGYGASGNRFADMLKESGLDEAADQGNELVQTYRSANYMITNFWKECDRALQTMYAGGEYHFGGPDNNLYVADGKSEFFGKVIPSIKLPNGTYIFLQNLRREAGDDGRVNYVYDQFKTNRFIPKRVWGSALCENICQALAFAVLKWQAIQIYNEGVPINLNVHDEWASVVPRDKVAQVSTIYYKNMKRVPDYLPQGLLDCEVEIGNNYADLKFLDVGAALGVRKNERFYSNSSKNI